MDQSSPERPLLEQPGGTRVLTAFGETPAEIQAELHKALERFGSSVPEHGTHWLAAPSEDRWSPAQVTEHVLLVNEAVGRIVTLLLSGAPLQDAPEVPGQTQGGRRLAAPALQPGEGQPWTDLQPRWKASAELLGGAAARLGEADLSRRYFHPFLGRLDAHDWMRMATFHTRHHRRQLSEGQAAGAAGEKA